MKEIINIDMIKISMLSISVILLHTLPHIRNILMASGERDSLHLGFLYLLCYAPVRCHKVKSPGIDVWNPQVADLDFGLGGSTFGA